MTQLITLSGIKPYRSQVLLGRGFWGRQSDNFVSGGKKLVRKVSNVVDQTGDLAYKYSGLKSVIDYADDKIFDPIVDSMISFVKKKLVEQYGSKIINVAEGTVQAYIALNEAPLIAYVIASTGGSGVVLTPIIMGLVATVVHSVYRELIDTAKNAGRKVTKSAKKFFDETVANSDLLSQILLDNKTEEEKNSMADQILTDTEKARENFKFAYAGAGIPPPNKIVRIVQDSPNGQLVFTEVTWYQLGKTVKTSLTPDLWVSKFKSNNPQNSNIVLQENGTVASMQVTPEQTKQAIISQYAQGYNRPTPEQTKQSIISQYAQGYNKETPEQTKQTIINQYAQGYNQSPQESQGPQAEGQASSFLPLLIGAGILLSMLG